MRKQIIQVIELEIGDRYEYIEAGGINQKPTAVEVGDIAAKDKFEHTLIYIEDSKTKRVHQHFSTAYVVLTSHSE